jgi:cytochrome P450/NADPH-cytochrome P450 reductase
MDTRFNSFYKDELHPFIYAMGGMLTEASARGTRPAFATYFMRGAQQKFESDIATLRRVSAEVVAERRKHPSDKKDLLNAMIKGKDPKTGEGMSDESIMNNMITFLIAGKSTSLFGSFSY